MLRLWFTVAVPCPVSVVVPLHSFRQLTVLLPLLVTPRMGANMIRGGALAPAWRENTLRSFQAAAASGATFVEFDVQVGVPSTSQKVCIALGWSHGSEVVHAHAELRPMVHSLSPLPLWQHIWQILPLMLRLASFTNTFVWCYRMPGDFRRCASHMA
jgi:hypothetical protein